MPTRKCLMLDADLTGRVAALCETALARLEPGATKDGVETVAAGLREPLRVAVAGRVKTGKSTLVNALLGHPISPTATGECTKVVLRFRYGKPPAVEVHARDGRSWELAVADGTLPSTLGADIDEIATVDVLMPYGARKDMVVIDTPGISSVNEQVSDKTEELLAMDQATRSGVAQADALVYLMADSIRAEDERALLNFRASALTAIGVLSRADQVRVAGEDPLDAARDLAGRWAERLRGVVSTVLPIAGLLGETAECDVANQDVHHLRALATIGGDEREDLLLSKDELLATSDLAEREARRRLHELLGLYGLRCALEWVDSGLSDAVDLTARLRELSGVSRLRQLLDETLAPRADALKANSALHALERLSYAADDRRNASVLRQLLAAELEDIRLEPEMHQLNELEAVRSCASGTVSLPDALFEEVLRMTTEGSPEAKVGLTDGGPGDIEHAALAGARRWTLYENDIGNGLAERRVAETMRRSYTLLWQDARNVAGTAAS